MLTDTIHELNLSYHQHLYQNHSNNTIVPPVCLICDRFVKPTYINLLNLTQLKQNHKLICALAPLGDIPMAIQKDYTFASDLSQQLFKDEDTYWFKEIIISPRSNYITTERKEGFITCADCFHSYTKKKKHPYGAL